MVPILNAAVQVMVMNNKVRNFYSVVSTVVVRSMYSPGAFEPAA